MGRVYSTPGGNLAGVGACCTSCGSGRADRPRGGLETGLNCGRNLVNYTPVHIPPSWHDVRRGCRAPLSNSRFEDRLMFSADCSLRPYAPRCAPLFCPSTIVLAKGGSFYTTERRELAKRICAAYPEAEVIESLGVPHNRVDLGESEPLRLHNSWEADTVLGEHQMQCGSARRGGNTCPNYWHFSPYGFCPYALPLLLSCGYSRSLVLTDSEDFPKSPGNSH